MKYYNDYYYNSVTHLPYSPSQWRLLWNRDGKAASDLIWYMKSFHFLPIEALGLDNMQVMICLDQNKGGLLYPRV